MITEADAAKVNVNLFTGCWEWTGATVNSGYGRVSSPSPGGSRLAHRFFYEHTFGAIPVGLVLDHTCSNKLCVNPAHLEPVSQKKNVHRSVSRAFGVSEGYFGCGHPMDEAHTMAVNCKGQTSYTRCRVCHRTRTRNAQRNKRNADPRQ